jgi:hypothetical protein
MALMVTAVSILIILYLIKNLFPVPPAHMLGAA